MAATERTDSLSLSLGLTKSKNGPDDVTDTLRDTLSQSAAQSCSSLLKDSLSPRQLSLERASSKCQADSSSGVNF